MYWPFFTVYLILITNKFSIFISIFLNEKPHFLWKNYLKIDTFLSNSEWTHLISKMYALSAFDPPMLLCLSNYCQSKKTHSRFVSRVVISSKCRFSSSLQPCLLFLLLRRNFNCARRVFITSTILCICLTQWRKFCLPQLFICFGLFCILALLRWQAMRIISLVIMVSLSAYYFWVSLWSFPFIKQSLFSLLT